MNNKKALFYLMAGTGLGNAARFEALYEEELHHQNYELHIYCWGRSLQYLKKKYEDKPSINLHPLSPYNLGHDKDGISSYHFFLSIPKYIKTFLINSRYIYSQAITHRPKLSIHDSDYHYFALIFAKVPRFAISQSWMIISRWNYLKGSNLKTKVNFFLYEVLELLFSYMFSSKILCPSFSKRPISSTEKILVVGPIVRKAFQSTYPNPSKFLAVLSGGSGIQREKLLALATRLKADDFLSNIESPKANYYESIDPSGVPILSKYKGVIIQAGHVLISECLALGIHFFAIPIDNHPEQFINTLILQKEYNKIDDKLAGADEKFTKSIDSKIIAQTKSEGAQEVALLLKKFLDTNS